MKFKWLKRQTVKSCDQFILFVGAEEICCVDKAFRQFSDTGSRFWHLSTKLSAIGGHSRYFDDFRLPAVFLHHHNRLVVEESADILRRATINRVKSGQAIRRSRLLVTGTKKLIADAKTQKRNQKSAVQEFLADNMELLRKRSREAREHSQQA